MDDPTETSHEAPVDSAAAAPATLSAAVEEALASWWSTTLESVGPLVSTQAYNALGVARDNLPTLLAAALR